MVISMFNRTELKVIPVFMIFTTQLFAQIPRGVPQPSQNSPIDFSSTSDIIIYIVIPAILIVIYLSWRIVSRKKARREQGNSENESREEKKDQ